MAGLRSRPLAWVERWTPRQSESLCLPRESRISCRSIPVGQHQALVLGDLLLAQRRHVLTVKMCAIPVGRPGQTRLQAQLRPPPEGTLREHRREHKRAHLRRMILHVAHPTGFAAESRTEYFDNLANRARVDGCRPKIDGARGALRGLHERLQ